MNELATALGMWSSLIYLVLGVAIGSGFLSNRNLNDPVRDPHLAIAEVLILLMAPVMVTLSVAIHASAPPDAQPYTLIALGWMVAAAATTSIVHFVELTVLVAKHDVLEVLRPSRTNSETGQRGEVPVEDTKHDGPAWRDRGWSAPTREFPSPTPWSTPTRHNWSPHASGPDEVQRPQ